jgi:hypothetical protein
LSHEIKSEEQLPANQRKIIKENDAEVETFPFPNRIQYIDSFFNHQSENNPQYKSYKIIIKKKEGKGDHGSYITS